MPTSRYAGMQNRIFTLMDHLHEKHKWIRKIGREETRRKDALSYTIYKDVCKLKASDNFIHILHMFRFIIPNVLGGKNITIQLCMKTLK